MLFLNLLASGPIFLIYFLIALVVAVTIHEAAHAAMANKLGDPTARLLGRLSINPLVHFDPLGALFLLVAGIGWGKPVPYNPQYFKNEKRDSLLTALAGPGANILVALIFSIPYRIAIIFNLPEIFNFWFYPLFDIISGLNLLLAAFNILPIPPLDGSKILYLFANKVKMAVIESMGPLILFGFLFISLYTGLLSRIIYFVLFWLTYFVRVFPAPPVGNLSDWLIYF